MTIQLSPLVHIEVAVRDAQAAYEFLHTTLGAEKVQEEFAGFLSGPNGKVIHVGLGDVVLQFVEPLVQQNSWYEQIQAKGPSVHNLTFTVGDIKETVKALAAEGVKPKFSFPLDWGRWLGPDNVKPDAQPVYMMDTMDRIGFHLELAESARKQPVARARYATGLDRLIGRVSPMLHVELTVPDVEATYRFLNKVFDSEKVEIEFANFLNHPRTRIIHVNLSNVVLQYCQPLVPDSPKAAHLARSGSAVHNITFFVPDMNEAMKRINQAGAQDLFAFPLDWGKLIGPEKVRPNVAPVHMVKTMDLLGFHLELGERPTDEELDFLYIDF